jgi:hypothetical protein
MGLQKALKNFEAFLVNIFKFFGPHIVFGLKTANFEANR